MTNTIIKRIAVLATIGTMAMASTTAAFANDGIAGTVIDKNGRALIDENGRVLEMDDTEHEGVEYIVRVSGRRGDISETECQWYGPYTTVKNAVDTVEEGLTGRGFVEIHVYKTEKNTSSMTFVGKTYFVDPN